MTSQSEAPIAVRLRDPEILDQLPQTDGLRIRAVTREGKLPKEGELGYEFNTIYSALELIQAVASYMVSEANQEDIDANIRFSVKPLYWIVEAAGMYAYAHNGMHEKGYISLMKGQLGRIFARETMVSMRRSQRSEEQRDQNISSENSDTEQNVYATLQEEATTLLGSLPEFLPKGRSGKVIAAQLQALSRKVLLYQRAEVLRYYNQVIPGVWRDYKQEASYVPVFEDVATPFHQRRATRANLIYAGALVHELRSPITALTGISQLLELKLRKINEGYPNAEELEADVKILLHHAGRSWHSLMRYHAEGILDFLTGHESQVITSDLLVKYIQERFLLEKEYYTPKGRKPARISVGGIEIGVARLPLKLLDVLVRNIQSNNERMQAGMPINHQAFFKISAAIVYLNLKGEEVAKDTPDAQQFLRVDIKDNNGGFSPEIVEHGFRSDLHGYADEIANKHSTGIGMSTLRQGFSSRNIGFIPTNYRLEDEVINPDDDEMLPHFEEGACISLYFLEG